MGEDVEQNSFLVKISLRILCSLLIIRTSEAVNDYNNILLRFHLGIANLILLQKKSKSSRNSNPKEDAKLRDSEAFLNHY